MQILLFISGIAILLFAMQKMESSLSKLGSNHLQQGLLSFTSHPIKGILFGLVATALLQSSSLVGLMTMAFVGAGIIPFRNAIGVILGSNLGTTFTGWLVALLGFKLNLTELSLPIMGLGALGIVFLKPDSQLKQAGQFIFALGSLLLGLSLMKDSIGFVVDLVDVSRLQNLPIFAYFGFGAVLTAVIQSSSATMMITLSAIHAGLIDLQSAAALIIGADLGTVSTVIIGAIGATAVKKQVALVHFCFNFITDILALLCLPALLFLVARVFTIDDPLFGLVAVHSSFNLVGLLLFIPLIDVLRRFVEGRFPDKDTSNLWVNRVSSDIPEAALEAVEKDTQQLMESAIRLNARRLTVRLPSINNNTEINLQESQANIDTVYSMLKNRENLLSDYILDMQRQALSREQLDRLNQLLVSIRDSLYCAKAIKDIHHDMQHFSFQNSDNIKQLRHRFKHALEVFYKPLIQVLSNELEFSPHILAELLATIEQDHSDQNAFIYELIDNNQLQKDSASTALNINREILFSAHSLINALEQLKLPGEQAKTVSEILNLKIT